MNETSRDWQAELERATSRQLPADVTLSKDAAELRDGWLALGQLLEESDRAFDPGRMLQKLELTSAAQDSVASPAPPRQDSRGSWKRLMAVVVAASVMIAAALTVWQFWDRISENPRVVPVARQPEMGGGSRDLSPSPASVDPSPETAWDDSFDEQLAVTQERIWQVRATSATSEARIETMWQAIEQFDSDLNSSSL